MGSEIEIKIGIEKQKLKIEGENDGKDWQIEEVEGDVGIKLGKRN